MSFLTKIFEKLSTSIKIEDKNQIVQLLLIRIFNIIGVILLTFSLVIDFINTQQLSLLILVIPFILLIVNLTLYASKVEKINSSVNLILIAFLIASIYNILRLPYNLAGIFWIFSFPVVSFSLKGKKIGNQLSVVFIVIAAGILIFQKTFSEAFVDYSYLFVIKIFGCYLIAHILFYAFEILKKIREKIHEEKVVELKKDNRIKDEFISHLSHQIRTPLNNIMVIANLLNETKFSDNQKDLMDTIIASTSTLVNVVNNIVKVTNVEFTASSSSMSTFNVAPTIKSSINILGEHNKDKVNIKLNINNDISNLRVYGDPLRLKQIFLNIIENIIDHSQNPKTTIDVSLNLMKSNEGSSDIRLISNISCDSTLPLPEEDIADKSSQFKFSNSKKDIIEEIPLCDLTIAKKILELNNGSLSIESGEGYTSFSFIISFEKPEADKAKKVSLEGGDNNLIKSAKKIKIADANLLLVEDNLINQKIVILSLKKLVKNIDVANNGKEALDKFGTSRYDLILMDIQMPVMNGILATKKIRELELSSNSQTPIIAITANALAGDKETCLAAGMNDYISKPFQVDILVQKMKKLIE